MLHTHWITIGGLRPLAAPNPYVMPRVFTPLQVLRCTPVLLFMLLFVTLLGYSLSGIAQQSTVVTNATIIQLHKAGISKDIISTKIANSACSFDLSTEGIIALKKEGVPDDIITIMIAKGSTEMPNTAANPELALEPGLYYFNPATREYIEMDAAILTNTKAGGLGEAMERSVSGLFNAKLKATLSGKEANMKITMTSPLFVFVFDKDKTGFNDNNQAKSNVESPNEFFLVKLTQGKRDREMVVAKENSVGDNIGIDDKVKVPFHYKKLQKGLYEVLTDNQLVPGEYCFMFAASTASTQGITHKVYDFSIQ